MKGKPAISPAYMTATYKFDSSDDLIDVVQSQEGYIYSRWDNPSVKEVEEAVAHLEGYECGIGFSSGMAAISTAVLSHICAGSRIVAMQEIYGGTYELFNDILPKLSVDTTLINCFDTGQLMAQIDKGLDILYLESPTNPLLRVVDIDPLVRSAKAKGAVIMMDNTFASPINQRPLDMGVDVVIHSATKYLGGHHDITAGLVCCNKAAHDKIWHYKKILGGVMDPMTAFLIMRGLRTLELRIARHNENAMKIARFLESHPKVKTTYYPGLESHPDHEVAKRQMKGFGGMLSFDVDGDFDQTKTVMDHLKLISLATSLGGVTSLANQPITNTHVALSPENRKKAGVSESLVRLSVGIEDADLLIQDLDQALAVALG
ncbi:MAG: aminotransferase class I/II-fold pyridoxal phosphate-dependent enzyme [Desulfobacteraceae bacterium]|nr:MAG: aminotransferase class I/II-fold pyridoxal phosphate-dependent enzyme [Desulfobacteraceae bacterium]